MPIKHPGEFGVNESFWNKKNVFLTGHSGFKGSWLSIWLNKIGANLTGYSLEPNTSPNLFDVCAVKEKCNSIFGDIRDYKKLEQELIKSDPEIIIHMAAQPLVLDSYENPIETYSSNVMGTVNLMNISRGLNKLRCILVVTTDKCYENQEFNEPFIEDNPLGGYDPYSSSKACAEIATAAFRSSFFNPQDYGSKHQVGVATARAGNVIGGGDWSRHRLLPDFIRAISNESCVSIRNPSATRPWQHVLEPLAGYLTLCEKIYNNGGQYGGSWNFGPNKDSAKNVEWIARKFKDIWGDSFEYVINNSEFNAHEANFLELDSTKAIKKLGWNRKYNIDQTINTTIDWYRSFLSNEPSIIDFTLNQIDEYQKI